MLIDTLIILLSFFPVDTIDTRIIRKDTFIYTEVCTDRGISSLWINLQVKNKEEQ